MRGGEDNENYKTYGSQRWKKRKHENKIHRYFNKTPLHTLGLGKPRPSGRYRTHTYLQFTERSGKKRFEHGGRRIFPESALVSSKGVSDLKTGGGLKWKCGIILLGRTVQRDCRESEMQRSRAG